ncbi:hypothetical protein DOY81_005184 [Sarcophaga bullata]|nr:hypothetical protein DOY81_005184 [Sarcophaga bullata]
MSCCVVLPLFFIQSDAILQNVMCCQASDNKDEINILVTGGFSIHYCISFITHTQFFTKHSQIQMFERIGNTETFSFFIRTSC